MKQIGWRIEDVAKQLKLSTQHTYRVARDPKFPRPIAIYGTIKIFDPAGVRRYAARRKAMKA